MFKLDDNFLEELGLGQLPAEQKQAFLEHVYGQLELRVGTRLSDGLSDEQLSEFESFIDRDSEKVRQWISEHAADYRNDPTFQQISQSAPQGTSEDDILAEYASLKWLSLNRPDYREVVRVVLDEIKQEIISNRDTILGAA
jgi:hypothetical protein